MMVILTGTLYLSMSGYFKYVWRKNLAGETVFWNIGISIRRNFWRAVLGGWFISVVGSPHCQMRGFHDHESDRTPTSEHVRILQRCLEKEPTRRNSFLKHRNQCHEIFPEELCLEVDSFKWLLVIIDKMWGFHFDDYGPGLLLLSMSGYFRDVWRKKLPGETVFGNIVISLMGNFRRAVLWRLIHSGGCL